MFDYHKFNYFKSFHGGVNIYLVMIKRENIYNITVVALANLSLQSRLKTEGKTEGIS